MPGPGDVTFEVIFDQGRKPRCGSLPWAQVRVYVQRNGREQRIAGGSSG